jgi:hypothetical protein
MVPMTKRYFEVRAVWDDEAKVFFTQSDVIGLNLEAPTLEEFERVVQAEAAGLIVANHLTADDLATRPLRDLIPTLVWRDPVRPDSPIH